MQKDVEKAYEKIKKRIAALKVKDSELEQKCREKWDVNWYGHLRWEDEYEKRHAKIQDEIRYLKWWETRLYDLHLMAVEQGVETGTKTERHFLCMDQDETEQECE